MALFDHGETVATPGALALLESLGISPSTLLDRHCSGDWGDLDDDDKKANDDALRSGKDRIFSSYVVAPGQKVWVITEWNRSVTTLLLPSEY